MKVEEVDLDALRIKRLIGAHQNFPDGSEWLVQLLKVWLPNLKGKTQLSSSPEGRSLLSGTNL